MDRPSEALPFFKTAYESSLKTLGAYHRHTWQARRGIARCLSLLKQFDESLDIHRSLFEEQKAHLGLRHTMTLVSMNNLAMDLNDAGQQKESEGLFRQLVQLQREETQQGTWHAGLALALLNLAEVLLERGELQETEKLTREGLEIYKNLNDDCEVAFAHIKISRVLFEQGRVCDAEREALLGHEVLDLCPLDINDSFSPTLCR